MALRTFSTMDHVAIMKKSWGLTDKILVGTKKIESRWYALRCRPWDGIVAGDRVFFKDSGDLVRISARVRKVLQFSDLIPGKVREILAQHGADDGIGLQDISWYYELLKNKRYCILIFLEDVQKVARPFDIDKRGFGAMSAWISVPDVRTIVADGFKR